MLAISCVHVRPSLWFTELVHAETRFALFAFVVEGRSAGGLLQVTLHVRHMKRGIVLNG